MPANFPEIWEAQVRKILTTQDIAPWLDGIPELDAEVYTLGAGTNTEKNIIHIPIETMRPEVLINNTTYPLEVQEHEDGSSTVTLDKYQTQPTSVSDDAVMGASYDKIESVTQGHRREIAIAKNKKAIHALAPAADSETTPVVNIVDGDVYGALVDLKKKFDDAEFPMEGRRVVLCSDHTTVLLKDRQRFANLLVDHNTGKLNQVIAGFEIYSYLGMPYYDTNGNKKPYKAIPVETDKQASIAFCVYNVAKKTGNTKQYFGKSEIDPINQTNLLAYRHYFIATPVEDKYIGAIL
ncbi:hypothetical protein GCM10007424_23720 [Flavobacterium suaedae]|uniref:Capsid protein n=1 Tax=Flavobacterium suaedae TaxID=1767027 RepID=A0ABQ1JZD1_9FLAO|nr:hypothetical protein [Flavobacterium suaedae]GGB82950.1 hypothetical protein GCM10007424_23720 [Flavobacterium suaedae]